MYSDPARLRHNVVKLRFSAEESALVNAWVDYTGEEKAALLRHLILEQVALALCMHDDSSATAMRAPQQVAL